MENKYLNYESLNSYQKRCLPTSNYWRVMQGQPVIEVPDSDVYYHEKFDKRCHELSVEYQEMKSRAKN